MSTRKKRIILGISGGVLALGLVGVIASQNTFNIGIGVRAEDPANVVWKHYAAVEPTTTRHGSKEFWANCSELGTRSLTKPAKGLFEEGGDFSKTAYFEELTPEDDRYVPYEYTVAFDSNGAAAIESVTVGYGKTLTAPTTPTRAEDAYYKSYTFDAWYANGKAFDFTKDTIKENVTLTAGWKYGDKKFDEVTLTKDNMTFGEKSAFMSFSGAFDQMAYQKSAVNQELKTQLIDEFGGADREKDGVFFTTAGGKSEGATTPVSLPKINFKDKLADGKVMSMEIGGRTDGCKMSYSGYQVFACSGHHIYNLTRAKVYFYMVGDVVKVRFVDNNAIGSNNIYTCAEKTFDLSEEVAVGMSSFTFDAFVNQYNRHFWLGHPRIVNGEYNYFDFSSKEHVTVENGTLKARGEEATSGVSPFGQWKDTVALSIDGVGVLGNGSTALKVNYPAIDFNSLFNKGQGLRFTLGSWNGQEPLKFGETKFGASGVKPANPDSHTVDTIVDTWSNFQMEITKVGMRVVNHFEKTETMVTLTADQLSGKEGLSFEIGSSSNNHFFYISNMKAFHA